MLRCYLTTVHIVALAHRTNPRNHKLTPTRLTRSTSSPRRTVTGQLQLIHTPTRLTRSTSSPRRTVTGQLQLIHTPTRLTRSTSSPRRTVTGRLQLILLR